MRGVTLFFALSLTAVLVGGAFLGNAMIPGGWAGAVSMASALASGAQSCSLGGVTVPSGTVRVFYIMPSVPSGQTCESISLLRACTSGSLSGSNNYIYANCKEDPNLSNIRTNLKKFLPYVWSTTWYPWFSNALKTDPANRGLALFKSQIAGIKAQGFNTVWLGGFSWSYLQPSPGVWNETALTALKAHLDVLKENNMRAIFQMNYVGPGYSPRGIDGCTWMNDPAQVQKFDDFVTGLGGQLARYNYMIYYSVFTEQTSQCLAQRGQYDLYKGLHLSADGSSSSWINPTTQQAAHDADVHAVNQMLKQSIGRVTKYIPSAVRSQMFVGIHDALVSRGQITDDAPVENPIDFDFFSFAHYPNYTELAAFPADGDIASSTTAYGLVFDALEKDKANIRRFYPDIPLLLGEFGWYAWDPVAQAPTLKQDSPARNLAHTTMIEWSVLKKIGFNVWGWLPLDLDDPSSATPYGYVQGLTLNMPDAKLLTSSPTPTTVLAAITAKLTGNNFANPCSWNGISIASGSTVTAYQSSASPAGAACTSEARTCINGKLSGSYQYATCTVTPAASCNWNGGTIQSGTSVTAYQSGSVPRGGACVSEIRSCSNGTLSGSYTNVACSVASDPVAPPVPSSVVSSCSADGTTFTLSWDPSAGATAYYANVFDTTVQQYVKGPNAAGTSPVSVAVTPGHTFTSWVYAANGNKWSASKGPKPLTCTAN